MGIFVNQFLGRRSNFEVRCLTSLSTHGGIYSVAWRGTYSRGIGLWCSPFCWLGPTSFLSHPCKLEYNFIMYLLTWIKYEMQLDTHLMKGVKMKETLYFQGLQNIHFMVLIFIMFVISMKTTLTSISFFFGQGHPKVCRWITSYPFFKSTLRRWDWLTALPQSWWPKPRGSGGASPPRPSDSSVWTH